jgi:von Willebrand factor type A domain/WD40-like Beta Propeller Repeat
MNTNKYTLTDKTFVAIRVIRGQKKYLIFLFLAHFVAITSSTAQPIFKGIRENIGKEVNDQFNQVQPVFSTDGATLFFSQGSGVNQQLEVWKTISDSIGHIIGKEKIKALNPNINQPKYMLQSLSSHQYLVSGSYTVYNKQLIYGRGISLFDMAKAKEDFVPEFLVKKSSKTLDSIFRRNAIFPFYHPFLQCYLWSQSDGNQSDIYLLLNEGSNFVKPIIIKLPATVNSGFNEITPWLDDEGRYLYFASDRPGGLGETDIYVSERLDGSFKNWSTPKNLGLAVNSNKADYNFIISPFASHAYFVSEKNTFGKADIFRIGLQQQDSTDGFSPLLLPTEKPDTSLQFKPNIHLPNNITFLLDISHSMAESRKMILLKKSMYKLVQQLRPTDKVSLVIFGSGVESILSGQLATNKSAILDAIQMLHANGGATNISAGLQRAYDQANQHFLPNANNELFVVTDGVFKLKTTDEQRAAANKKILLTAVVVGNDPETSAAFAPLVLKANGQMLHIKNETYDINLLLQNVRMNAAAKAVL